MFLLSIIVFISFISLIILHELGHFLLAKKFGVKVEEFGIGYPPRIFGKKFGETIYSLNLLPFGAFVRLPGEIERIEDYNPPTTLPPPPEEGGPSRIFSAQPVSKRAIIALGGVLSFWIMAAIIFCIVFNLGARVAIEDEENFNLADPKVQIVTISPDSPAQIAGLEVGDAIKNFSIFNLQFSINTIKELQELTEKYKGQEITLTIERGKEVFEISLIPRVSPPEGEGPMGVALLRTAIKKYPWFISPWQGILATGNLTLAIIKSYGQAVSNVFKGLPSGVQLMGPVGTLHLLTQAGQLGVSHFLQFFGLISIYLALFNVLPIPAVDGGKLLFLGIEAARKKPVSPKTEQKITTFCFSLLVALAIWVTIKDISRIF